MNPGLAVMKASPRCGASTRAGTPCQLPRIRGRKRCRLHGGATGSGAPQGNRNALTHGAYTATERTRQQTLRALWRQMREGI